MCARGLSTVVFHIWKLRVAGLWVLELRVSGSNVSLVGSCNAEGQDALHGGRHKQDSIWHVLCYYDCIESPA